MTRRSLLEPSLSRVKRRQLFSQIFVSVFVLSLVLTSGARCDLSLFSSPESELSGDERRFDSLCNNRGDEDRNDKLSLFGKSRSCTEHVDKSNFCSEYCSQLYKNLVENETLADSIAVSDEKFYSFGETPLNLTTALHYYRSFIHKFLNTIKRGGNEDIEFFEREEKFSVRLEVELSKHELTKLKRFTDLTNDTKYASDSIEDITDILKNMMQEITAHSNSKSYQAYSSAEGNLYESMFSAWSWYDFLKAPVQVLVFVLLAFASYFLLRLVLVNKIKLKVSLRMTISCLLVLMFIISAINNHSYLTQKKQILNQQRLKEMIPEECLLNNDELNNKQEDKSGMFKSIFKMVKKQFGYSPTSRKCLEYQEAVYITGKQINYMETIVFTVSESVRPLAITFGEFINEFYSALTKDLSFYQYMPLIALVTVVLVPFSLYFLSLISLLLFNYEFNFFHLISFRKNVQQQQPVVPNPSLEALENQKKEMLKLLKMIKKETKKAALEYKEVKISNNTANLIPIKSVLTSPVPPIQQAIQYTSEKVEDIVSSSTDDLETDLDMSSLEYQDLNETLEKSLKTYFEKKHSTDEEVKLQFEKMKSENARLNEILTNTSTTKELMMLNESGDFTANSLANSSMASEESKQSSGSSSSKSMSRQNSKIEIGMSKTVKLNSTPPHTRIFKSDLEAAAFLAATNGDKSKLVKHHHHRSSNLHYRIENEEDEEDDEEDIYVILDEN